MCAHTLRRNSLPRCTHRESPATLLHLFGMDHTKLIYTYNNREQTITDTKPCRVVTELLA